jgi:hypothetical protein
MHFHGTGTIHASRYVKIRNGAGDRKYGEIAESGAKDEPFAVDREQKQAVIDSVRQIFDGRRPVEIRQGVVADDRCGTIPLHLRER